MRFVSFCERALKWLFRFVFSRKFLLLVGGLLVVLIAAVCVAHHFYNKYAEQHWIEVQQRWEQEVGITDLDGLFPKVPDDKDLYKDPFFLEYLNRDEQRLRKVERMDLSREDGGKLHSRRATDFKMWFPDDEVETEVEAAKLVLEILKPFEVDANRLQGMINEKRVGSSYNPELSVSSLQAPDWMRIELLQMQEFFIDRTYLRKLAGDQEGAIKDLRTVLRILDIVGHEPNFYHFSVKSGSMLKVSVLMENGLERSLWATDDLNAFQASFSKLNLQQAFKNIPFGERVYGNQVRGLYDEIGQEVTEKLLMGEDAKCFEGHDVYFDWSDNDWEDKVNWDKIVGLLVSPLVPNSAENEGLALADEFAMDVLIPHFKKELSIDTYRSLKTCIPEYAWHEEIVAPYGDAYVMYYGGMLHLEMQRRLFLVSLALETKYKECGVYPEGLTSLLGVDLANIFDSEGISYIRHSDDSYEIASPGMSYFDSLAWMGGSHSAEDKRLTITIDKSSPK